jgi:hypothetical protein
MVMENLGPNLVIIIIIAVAMGIANVCLLIGLLRAYWGTYKEIKSQFTIGLLYFASLILIQNILVTISIGIPLLITVLPFQVPDSDFVRPHFALFFINLIQLVALVILYRITKE